MERVAERWHYARTGKQRPGNKRAWLRQLGRKIRKGLARPSRVACVRGWDRSRIE